MSKRINLNLKNVTSRLQNFSEFLPGFESIKHNGFSRLVVPRSLPVHKPEYNYFQQDYFRRNTLDLTKLLFPKVPTENGPPKQKTLKITPFSITCLDTLNFGSINAPVPGLPWTTSYHCYYDIPKPECPPSDPKPCPEGDKKSREPPKGDPCSRRSSQKRDPCGSRKSTPKRSPCDRKMSTNIPLKCQKPCGGGGPPPTRKKPDCGKGGKGGGARKKPVCGKGGAGKPKKPDCSKTKTKKSKVSPCKPPKAQQPPCGGKRGPKKKGNICPPAKPVPDCPPKSKGGGRGSKCAPIKRPKCGGSDNAPKPSPSKKKCT